VLVQIWNQTLDEEVKHFSFQDEVNMEAREKARVNYAPSHGKFKNLVMVCPNLWGDCTPLIIHWINMRE
jgi:hypothetical protein